MCCSSSTTSSDLHRLVPRYSNNNASNGCTYVKLWGLQVSALLGRIPSAVGYQPTLATDMGTMQERITTTRKGSITSVQVLLVLLYTGFYSPWASVESVSKY